MINTVFVVKTLSELCVDFMMTKIGLKNHLQINRSSVINLSDFVLEPLYVSLLGRGLTFCPTPSEPIMGDLRCDLDAFHQNVHLKAHFQKSEDKNTA